MENIQNTELKIGLRDNIQGIQIKARLREIIEDIETKKSKFLFYVPDTKGRPMASVAQIYRIAYRLKEKGYRSYILHSSNKYYGVKDWLDGKFAELEHLSLEELQKRPDMTIKGCDFFIVPEMYGHFIKELNKQQSNGKKLPSETIVLLQNHVLALEEIITGEQWSHFGVETVIASSQTVGEFIGQYQKGVDFGIINPVIEQTFYHKKEAQTPFVFLNCRNPKDAERITKMFYMKYPQYGWIGFKTVSGLKSSDYASAIQKAMLAVWVDDHSTFGTFPLECMASDVPVIAKLPDLIPEWAIKGDKLADNAIYVDNILSIPDQIAQFVESWLLDSVPESFYNLQEIVKKYSQENFEEQFDRVLINLLERKTKKLKNLVEKYEN